MTQLIAAARDSAGSSGGDVVEANNKGEKLLHIAAAAPDSEACLAQLLKDCGDSAAAVNAKTKSGKTPLHLAAAHGEQSKPSI